MGSAEARITWEGRVVDGKFPLQKWLGGSDHSAIFLTTRKGSAEPVAIKLISADSAVADGLLSRWRAAAKLSHPNLIRIYESGRCDMSGTPIAYVVMEHAEEDLSQILPERALSASEVTDLVPPLLDTLSYLHKSGLVHGRIKPSNVLAVGNQIKLSGDQVGAPTDSAPGRMRRDVYDAPETAAGTITPEGDVWSFGVTLVAALAQNAPIMGSSSSQADPLVPASVAEPFRGIARECMRTDPKRRCSIADIQARLEPPARSVPEERVTSAAIQATPVEHYGFSWRWLIPVAVLLLAGFGFFLYHQIYPPKSAVQAAPVRTETPPESKPSPSPGPTRPASATRATARVSGPKGGVLLQVVPEIPKSAMNTISGTIKINARVYVDPSGKVTAARLTTTGPSKYFAQRVLQAAQQWQFSAPVVNGQPIPSEWVLHFRLKRTSSQVSPEQVRN